MAMLSFDAKMPLMLGCAVKMFSVAAWPLAVSQSPGCIATTLRPQAVKPALAPSERNLPVDWVMMPCRIATSEPFGTPLQM